MENTQIDITAFHEAGHALIAHVKGIPVLEVYSDGDVGYTLVDWGGSKLISIVYFYLAGEVSERLFAGERYSARASYNDHAYATNALFLITSNSVIQEKIWNNVINATEEEFSKPENKKKITMIAEALTRRNSLSKEEFLELVKD